MKTSVILHGLHNELSLDQMKVLVTLAEKYGGHFRHVVTGIQITNLEKDDKAFLLAELPEGISQVVHRGVNSIIACAGKAGCKNGQMETRELEDYIERKHYGRSTGHKCKIGISGCGRNCPDSMVKDIAFVGTPKGFLLAIGGNTGFHPHAGDIIARDLSIEQAKKEADILIDFYAEKSEARERLGKTIERLGNPLEGIIF